MKERTGFVLFVLAALILSTLLVRPPMRANASGAKLLEFDTMIGVPRPYTGATNAIRGVPGGGLPWVINGVKGELSANGKLEIRVDGLVFDPNDPDVVARGLANSNNQTQFRAIVSCQTKDANGNAAIANILTEAFPATTGLVTQGGGDANIETRVALPKPCIAPIVFVTSAGGSWFAATGN